MRFTSRTHNHGRAKGLQADQCLLVRKLQIKFLIVKNVSSYKTSQLFGNYHTATKFTKYRAFSYKQYVLQCNS